MNALNYLSQQTPKAIVLAVCLFFSALQANTLYAETLNTGTEAPHIDWPQELTMDQGTLVIYQPQPESLKGKTLTGRAAMSMESKNSDTPIYGVFWFSSKIATDRDTDTVTISDIKVNKVGWPDSKDAAEERFTSAVERTLVHAKFKT